MLVLFSGDEDRPDGAHAATAKRGCEAVQLDWGTHSWCDMRLPEVQETILASIPSFRGVSLAPPCISFASCHDEGPNAKPWRTWEAMHGGPHLSAAANAFLAEQDGLIDFARRVILACVAHGVEVVFENPAPREDEGLPSFWRAKAHMPQVWATYFITSLRTALGDALEFLVFPMCAFGPGPHGYKFQKWCGLLASKAAAQRFRTLGFLSCRCSEHDRVEGCTACGTPLSRLAAAYPGPLFDALIYSLTGLPIIVPPPFPHHSPSPPPKRARTAAAAAAAAAAVATAPETSAHAAMPPSTIIPPVGVGGGDGSEPGDFPHGAHIRPASPPRPRPVPSSLPPTSQQIPSKRTRVLFTSTLVSHSHTVGQGWTREDSSRSEIPSTHHAPTMDRSISTGRVSDGSLLSSHIRAAITHAREAPSKWASFRNLQPSDIPQLRSATLPDLQPQRRRTAKQPAPSQPGAAIRLRAFRAALGRNVYVADLFDTGEYDRFNKWMADAQRGRPLRTEVFPQSSMSVLARGFRWDCRDPANCIPIILWSLPLSIPNSLARGRWTGRPLLKPRQR